MADINILDYISSLDAATEIADTDYVLVRKADDTAEKAPGSILKNTSYKLVASDGSPDPALSVDAAGKVGIGTSSPGHKLHVYDATVPMIAVDGPTEIKKVFIFKTATAYRWALYSDDTAESGSNAGSDFIIARYADAGTWIASAFTITRSTGLVNVTGEFTAGTKTFYIDHPAVPTDKTLTHATFEGPEHGLIYRGKTKLVAGKATINLDTYFGMTAGTFAALTQDVVVQSLQNQDGFDRVKPGKLTADSFDIICENATSTDEIAWVVMAARADKLVKFSDQNDAYGRLILEVDKPEATASELKALESEVVETDDQAKDKITENVPVGDLTKTKGNYIHYEAYGVELPTKIVTYKYKKEALQNKAK